MQNNAVTPLAPVGPVTAQTIEHLIQSARAEGLPDAELEDLIKLLHDLKSGTAAIPAPETTLYEKVLPDGTAQAIYTTTRLENPEQELDRLSLDELVPVQPVHHD
jgi:hypothetical protein